MFRGIRGISSLTLLLLLLHEMHLDSLNEASEYGTRMHGDNGVDAASQEEQTGLSAQINKVLLHLLHFLVLLPPLLDVVFVSCIYEMNDEISDLNKASECECVFKMMRWQGIPLDDGVLR